MSAPWVPMSEARLAEICQRGDNGHRALVEEIRNYREEAASHARAALKEVLHNTGKLKETIHVMEGRCIVAINKVERLS